MHESSKKQYSNIINLPVILIIIITSVFAENNMRIRQMIFRKTLFPRWHLAIAIVSV